MIEYAYENLFATHNETHMIIVPNSATLTWDDYAETYVSDSNFTITNEDLKEEAFSLDESICSENNLKFGLCEASYCKFTIYNKTTIPNLKDEVLAVYVYFDDIEDSLFKVCVFTVTEDKYTAGRANREISGYDWNYTLNNLDITSWYNRYFSDGQRKTIIYAIVDLFNWINGTNDYANDKTSPQIPVELDSEYTLTNGAFQIGKTIESDTVTFGFFMNGILEFNGCFGHITREGKFKMVLLEWYDKQPVRIVSDEDRVPPTNYDDINTWGIGQIDVYDNSNKRKFTVRNTDKKKPSIYVMIDPWVIADREAGDSATITALNKMHEAIHHQNYCPCNIDCIADLCVEVGDRINVEFEQPEEWDTKNWFRSYVLERHYRGIHGMRDTYMAKGDKKQPLYKPNDNWHIGESDSTTTTATDGSGTGGVSEVYNEHDKRLIQVLRNLGFRIPDTPEVTVVYTENSSQVEITWTDPADIIKYRPIPAPWAGTIVVRKEGSAPVHQWGVDNEEYGGEVLVNSTTRDEYSQTPFIDNTIEPNKRYYYAIMPYTLAEDDPEHPIYHYNWTKVFSVDTQRFITAPTILALTRGGKESWDGSEIAIVWSGNSNSLTVQIDNGSIVFKMYIGNTLIYTFTSYIGTSEADLNKISVSFLQDTDLQLAKPSFVYMNGLNDYSYNQETPTDAEMADIYTWLSAGLS